MNNFFSDEHKGSPVGKRPSPVIRMQSLRSVQEVKMKVVIKEGNETCMSFSVKLFRVVGCWPNPKNKHKRSEKLYYWYMRLIYMILLVYTAILSYGLVANIWLRRWKSIEEAIEDIIVFATGFIVLLKISLFLWNRTKLQNMIDYLNEDLNKREVKDEEDCSVIRSCIKHEKSLTKIYIFLGYCITFLYTASSIIKMIKQRSATGDEHTLPLKYPFRPRFFVSFVLLYIHQMAVMILNGHIGTLADSFFSCLAYYICGHFEIIKNRIAKEGGVITKDFVSYHNELIRFVGKLQSIFETFLMFQLISNSLLICLGLLQITQTDNIKLLHYIKCFIYVIMKLLQMFLYCWYGEEVKKRSCAISFEAYSGNWYKLRDKKTSFDLRMVLLRAQKPVQIKARKFFVMSLPTLAKVMHTAYSFFTVIKSTHKST